QPNKSKMDKSKSNAIRPDRDRPTMETKIVMNTKKPKTKLSPRSSIQKGNSGASVGFCTIIPHSVVCQLGPVRAFICGATVGVSGPRSFSKTIPLWVTTKVLTPDD